MHVVDHGLVKVTPTSGIFARKYFESTQSLNYKCSCLTFLRECEGGGGYEIWGKNHEISQTR